MHESSLEENDTAQLRRRNRELSILNTIAQALNREVNLERALRVALAESVALFELQTGWVWLLHAGTNTPYLAAAHNLPPALAGRPALMDGSKYCHCLDAYQSGELPIAANVDIVTCSRLKGLVDGTDGLRCHATVPLYAHGKPMGLLNVASTDWRELSADELRLLYTVGDMLSIAVERARLFERSAEFGVVEERSRLAREIHDTLAQGLAAISLRLETADALLDNGVKPEDTHDLVMQALRLTRSTLEEARRSVLDLRAAPLDGRTLYSALSALVQEHAEESGFDVEITAHDMRPLSPRLEVGLYRIAQEALANISRHAGAKSIVVHLFCTPEAITLRIGDDGSGFDPDDTPPGRFGLIGMSERVKLLGGQLDLCSAAGDGTQITVTIPL